jgi:transcriptional regulator with XRE-family HTH domain
MVLTYKKYGDTIQSIEIDTIYAKGGEYMNGKTIKQMMYLQDLTQAEVAERMGIAANTLNSKINGKTTFKISEVEQLIEILGIEDIKAVFFNQKV